MQKDTLLALLHQPSNLLEDHLEELEEIIQKYPFFHLPHTLIAKLLHDRQSSLASQKIRRASLYVYNRAILKDFILKQANKLDVETELNYQEKPHRNLFADIQQEIEEFDKKIENSSIEDLDKELASITESYLPKDYLAEETKKQEENQETEIIEQTDNQKEQNSLIDDFLSSFNKSTEQVSVSASDEDLEKEALKLFDEGKIQEAIAIYEQLKLKFPEKAAYYQSQIDIFSMDFDNMSSFGMQISESIDSALDDNLKIDSHKVVEEFLNTSISDTNKQEDIKVEEPTEEVAPITDISTPDDISLAKSQQDTSEESITETIENKPLEGVEVSESQAIAYFNEGNVEKAIEIYRQLMLQNPDKKAYFASQIEILES